MTAFRIATTLSLPEEAAVWTFADLAIKSAGKTYAACVLAEEMVKAGVPIIALDGLGVWWGLRVGMGGHKGLPIVIFGGSHKDISIPTKADKGRPLVDEERLKLMVRAILEARVSAVLDTSEFSKGMQRRIVAVFVNELYRLNAPYGVRHVFIEEADLWCPQRIVGDVAQSAGAIDDLVRRGGNFNLGCTLISQRSAVLNKDVLTQANCLIVLRILHKLDKKAVETWVESMARPDDPRIKKWYDSLRDLKDGEAWIWHPQTPKIFERVQFRRRETLHATREYFRQAEFQQKDIKMTDVEGFIQKFKAAFEPAPKVPEKQLPITPNREIRHVAREPLHSEEGREPIIVAQATPRIQIQQFKPTLHTPVEQLNQPTEALGKVAVVLKTYQGRSDRWTNKSIKEAVRAHAWEDLGVDEAIDQLIRWEILKRQSNNYLKFYEERVQISEINEAVVA